MFSYLYFYYNVNFNRLTYCTRDVVRFCRFNYLVNELVIVQLQITSLLCFYCLSFSNCSFPLSISLSSSAFLIHSIAHFISLLSHSTFLQSHHYASSTSSVHAGQIFGVILVKFGWLSFWCEKCVDRVL